MTFATNEDVKRVLCQGVIFFRGKQINVGPAVKRLVTSDSLTRMLYFNMVQRTEAGGASLALQRCVFGCFETLCP